jgi:hypothetical protein
MGGTVSTNAWESTETGRALAFPGDGLLDVFLGLILLDAWTILRSPPGAGSGGSLVILFPLLLVAKRAITLPRLSPTPPEPPRPTTLRRTSALAVALLLAVGAGLLLAPSARAALLAHLWGLVTILGLGLVAAAGARLRAWRFVVYGGLAFLALGLGLHEQRGAAMYLTPALAALMVGWGGVLLVRFVTANPRNA